MQTYKEQVNYTDKMVGW